MTETNALAIRPPTPGTVAEQPDHGLGPREVFEACFNISNFPV